VDSGALVGTVTDTEFRHYVQTCSNFFIQVIIPLVRRREAEIQYFDGEPMLVMTEKGRKKRLDTKPGVCHTVLVGDGRHRTGVAGQGDPAAEVPTRDRRAKRPSDCSRSSGPAF
jgi:hypothetical protein